MSDTKVAHIMELHQVPNCTWVELQINGLPHIFFDHIDGMYSYCKDIDGHVCHFTAWTLVRIVDEPKDSYKNRK